MSANQPPIRTMGDRGHLGLSSPSKEPPSCAHDWNRDGNSEAMGEESLACLFPDCVHASQSCTLQGRACLDPHPAPSNVRSAAAVVHPVPDLRHAAPASEAGVMSEPHAPLSRPSPIHVQCHSVARITITMTVAIRPVTLFRH